MGVVCHQAQTCPSLGPCLGKHQHQTNSKEAQPPQAKEQVELQPQEDGFIRRACSSLDQQLIHQLQVPTMHLLHMPGD